MRRVLSGIRRFADNDLVHDAAAFVAMSAFIAFAVFGSTTLAATVSAWRLTQ